MHSQAPFWTYCALATLLFSAHALAHNDQTPLSASTNTDWASRHMKEEHHIDSFDWPTFFHLHDFHSVREWSTDDIRRFYGLFDRSNQDVSEEAKVAGVQKVLDLFDADRSGSVSYDEFTKASASGTRLPDLGFGPGHHGDDEYEYEIHHFEKYHGDGEVRVEDLTHPEDIEHFRLHDEMERKKEEWEKRLKNAPNGIIEENIPQKFRRS